jgi:hypothetical protein
MQGAMPVGSGDLLGVRVLQYDTITAAMSAWNERAEKIIGDSICLNPHLRSVENGGYAKLLRFIKPIKQLWIISTIRALNGACALVGIKPPTLLRDIIRCALGRGVPIGGDNPNSPKSTCESPEMWAIHKWTTLKQNQISIHGTRTPNEKS